jgi:6-pyruvoyltetrahydropterin/6-carboxytetrahydropterin synthase
MYEASKVVWFCAAHQVRFDNGECERLHGHNWRVRVTAQARTVDRTGYVVDFARLKKATWESVEQFDHGNLNDLPPFTDLNPTAENLARHVHDRLARLFNDERVRIHRVEIWETENNRAAYVDDGAWTT